MMQGHDRSAVNFTGLTVGLPKWLTVGGRGGSRSKSARCDRGPKVPQGVLSREKKPCCVGPKGPGGKKRNFQYHKESGLAHSRERGEKKIQCRTSCDGADRDQPMGKNRREKKKSKIF